MRDIYEELGRNTRAVKQRLEAEPYKNPWKEIADAEVCMMLSGFGATDLPQFECTSGSRMSSKTKAMISYETDDPLNQILRRSQELIEGASAVLQQPVRRQRSPTVESFHPINSDHEEGLEQLELQVAEGMEKLSQWYNIGRRASVSASSAATCPFDPLPRGTSTAGSRAQRQRGERSARGQPGLASHGSIGTGGSSSAEGSADVWDPTCDSSSESGEGDADTAEQKNYTSCTRVTHSNGHFGMADLLEMAVDLRKDNQKLQKKVEELWVNEQSDMPRLSIGNSSHSEVTTDMVGRGNVGPQSISPSQRVQPRLMQQPQTVPEQSTTNMLQQQLQTQLGLLQQQQQKLEGHNEALLEREQKLQTWSDQLIRKEQTLAEMQQVAMRMVALQAKATAAAPFTS